METVKKGKVILAGAGPGDAELITLKLQRVLGQADIIITDRLVNPEIIEFNKKENAEVIIAGKQHSNNASYTQTHINNIIVEHALAGKTVLRLKGGDVAFFSNLLGELQSIVENDIAFEIIPGITAAAGASAYTGIPLTARGYSQAVQFLTFNPNSFYGTEKWKSLATSNDTLVFYMACKNIMNLVELLLRYTKNIQTPIAVIEQATTVHQKIHTTTLQNCAINFADMVFSSPSLIIIGNVVTLHKQFDWFTKTTMAGSIFNELENNK